MRFVATAIICKFGLIGKTPYVLVEALSGHRTYLQGIPAMMTREFSRCALHHTWRPDRPSSSRRHALHGVDTKRGVLAADSVLHVHGSLIARRLDRVHVRELNDGDAVMQKLIAGIWAGDPRCHPKPVSITYPASHAT
jgi:hypothetical protein